MGWYLSTRTSNFTYFKDTLAVDAQTKILTLNWLNLKVGLKEDLFKPRQKIIEVDLQRRNEEKLLDFIEKKFVIDMMKARQEHVSSKPKSF